MLTGEMPTYKCSFVNIYEYNYLEGVIEVRYLENMVNNGGIIIVMTIGLIIAFVFKTICSLCYDEVIGKIKSQNFIGCKRIKPIIEEFNNEIKNNRQINLPEYYLKSELHKWKCFGMNLDRINNYGNIAITICMIIGATMDLIILSDIGNSKSIIIENINKASVYTFVPLIFLGAFKLFDEIIALDYKKNIIFNEILNYISNPREYVRFAERINVEEFMDNTGKSKSLVDNQNTVTGITDSNNKTITGVADSDNKTVTGAADSDKNTTTGVVDSDNKTILINTNNISKKSDEECVKDKELVINEVLDEFLA